MGGVGSIVYTTRGGGEGDGGRSNDGGGLRPVLKEGISGEKEREMAGVQMGGLNVLVLAHSSFMPIKCTIS